MSIIKPLLATKADLNKLVYPVLATPKLDGIRCLMVDGIAMSRSMKPIPNGFVQEELAGLHGLDGELMIAGDFNNVQSGIMKHTGKPDFVFHVFDSFVMSGAYIDRVADIEWVEDNHRIQVLHPKLIHNEEELNIYEERCIAEGYEGVMVRDPEGRYKHGRSTVKEGILLKIKRFHDDEGILVDIIEKMHNDNPLEEDELGYAKRSSCKENLSPANTSGSLVISWNGLQFKVGFGPGITDAIKQEWWDRREQLKGQALKFSYQELSKDGIPRFGKALGFRHEDDM